MKIALAQINPLVGAFASNAAKVIDFAARARSGGAELVVFPELALCGYPPYDLLLNRRFADAALETLRQLAAEITGVPALVGFVEGACQAGYSVKNACALLAGGKVETVLYKSVLKVHPWFDESRYFLPGKTVPQVMVAGKRLGIAIGAEMDFSEWGADTALGSGIDLIVNPSALPYSGDDGTTTLEAARKLALRLSVPVLHVNQVGGNDELVFAGKSFLVDSKGEIIARAQAFEEDLVLVNLDEGSGEIRDQPQPGSDETLEALTLGTRDYMRKCGFTAALVGLSGGVDSAVAACIASRAAAPGNVLVLSMPSPYSSAESVTDARQLAANLGVELAVIPIEQAMRTLNELLAKHFAGQKAGVAEENIQARVRGVLLMAFSNKFGHLLLATGNRSEAATGYATLYGDMCGGLSVIGDLYKTEVYRLAEHINARAGRPVIPESIINKAPSAELRPGQLDQETLPPYAVLDEILALYLDKSMSAGEIVDLGYEKNMVLDVIARIHASEHKRRQAAPVIRVRRASLRQVERLPFAHGFRERSLMECDRRQQSKLC